MSLPTPLAARVIALHSRSAQAPSRSTAGTGATPCKSGQRSAQTELGEFASDDLVDVTLGKLEITRMSATQRLDRIRPQKNDLSVRVIPMGLLSTVVCLE